MTTATVPAPARRTRNNGQEGQQRPEVRKGFSRRQAIRLAGNLASRLRQIAESPRLDVKDEDRRSFSQVCKDFAQAAGDFRLIDLTCNFKPASGGSSSGLGNGSDLQRDIVKRLRERLASVIDKASALHGVVARWDNDLTNRRVLFEQSQRARTNRSETTTISISGATVCGELTSLVDTYGADAITYDEKDNILRLVLGTIVLKGINLGRFRIDIRLGQLPMRDGRRPYSVVALEPNVTSVGSLTPHPHVRGSELCEGEAQASLSESWNSGRFADAVRLIHTVLLTYNPSSPFQKIEVWYQQEEKTRYRETYRLECLRRLLTHAKAITGSDAIPTSLPRPVQPTTTDTQRSSESPRPRAVIMGGFLDDEIPVVRPGFDDGATTQVERPFLRPQTYVIERNDQGRVIFPFVWSSETRDMVAAA